MPDVSEDPKPYYPYPTIYCTSEDSSWTESDTSTSTPYQERNIFETHFPEGAYIEKAGSAVFIITYLPLVEWSGSEMVRLGSWVRFPPRGPVRLYW